jgi:hypothetical protein
MNTQYQPLVKLKKREVDETTKYISKLEKYQKDVEEVITNLKIEMQQNSLPTYGNLNDLQQHRSIQHAYIYQLRALDEEINKVTQTIASAQAKAKMQNIEYEKYLHLDKNERLKARLRLEKLEQKSLDEIGNILFFTQQR